MKYQLFHVFHFTALKYQKALTQNFLPILSVCFFKKLFSVKVHICDVSNI